MTEHEKSISIAGIRGWRVREVLQNPVQVLLLKEEPKPFTVFDYVDDEGHVTEYYDLYRSEHMHIAWDCHLWALKKEEIRNEYREWWEKWDLWLLDDAQRRWLDKIFTICVEHNLIEESANG